MKFVPSVSQEVDELFSLACNDVDLAKSIREILDSRAPLVLADVDSCSTNSTGDRVFTYHLSDPVLLITARAKNLDTVDVPVRN